MHNETDTAPATGAYPSTSTNPTPQTRTLEDDVQHLVDLIDTSRNALRNGASAAAEERLGTAADLLKGKILPRTSADSKASTAGQDAGASDTEFHLSDLAITLESARTTLTALDPADAINAVHSMLQGAEVTLEKIAAARKPEPGPKPAAVDASGVQNRCTCTIYADFRAENRDCPIHGDETEPRKRDDLYEAQRAAEGQIVALGRLVATVSALSTSYGDGEELRQSIYSILELLRPIFADAQGAFDLIAAHCRPAVDDQK